MDEEMGSKVFKNSFSDQISEIETLNENGLDLDFGLGLGLVILNSKIANPHTCVQIDCKSWDEFGVSSLFYVTVQRLKEVLPDVSGPKHENPLHGKVGEGNYRHPGRKDHLYVKTWMEAIKSFVLYTHCLKAKSGPGKLLRIWLVVIQLRL